MVRSCYPHAQPQAGGSPLVGCPRLLILYIRSFPPKLEGISSIRNLRMCHAVVTRGPPNMAFILTRTLIHTFSISINASAIVKAKLKTDYYSVLLNTLEILTP
jgi:hypothetical protein